MSRAPTSEYVLCRQQRTSVSGCLFVASYEASRRLRLSVPKPSSVDLYVWLPASPLPYGVGKFRQKQEEILAIPVSPPSAFLPSTPFMRWCVRIEGKIENEVVVHDRGR